MRRVLTVVIATLGGIALLASFHTTPGIATRTGSAGPDRTATSGRRNPARRQLDLGSGHVDAGSSEPAGNEPSRDLTADRVEREQDHRRPGLVELLRRRAGGDRRARAVS